MKLNNAAKAIISPPPDEEENVGFEVAARSPNAAPATAEMIPEELEDFEEENAPAASNRCLTKKRLFGVSVVAALVMAVGVAWSVKSPASSKTINVSKQVAVVATDPIDHYVKFDGDGFCLDKDGDNYPYARIRLPRSSVVGDCAARCECAQGIEGVKLRGFRYMGRGRSADECWCEFNWLNPQKAKDQQKIAKLNEACDAAGPSYQNYADGIVSAVIYSATTFDACNPGCRNCVKNVEGVQYSSYAFDATNNLCQCEVEWLNPATEQSVIDALTTSCGGDYEVLYPGQMRNGSGKAKSTDGDVRYSTTFGGDCYEFKGSNKSSKASKSPK